MKRSLGNFKGILLVALIVMSVGLIANDIFSNFHLNRILNSVENTEDAMEEYKRKLELKPTQGNCYRSAGVASREYCGYELNNWVLNRVVPASKSLREELSWNSYQLSIDKPFPFGGEFGEPIARYRDHLQAWIDYSGDIEKCKDLACLQNALNKPNEVTISFKIAKTAFEDSEPLIDLFGSAARIDKVFEN